MNCLLLLIIIVDSFYVLCLVYCALVIFVVCMCVCNTNKSIYYYIAMCVLLSESMLNELSALDCGSVVRL